MFSASYTKIIWHSILIKNRSFGILGKLPVFQVPCLIDLYNDIFCCVLLAQSLAGVNTGSDIVSSKYNGKDIPSNIRKHSLNEKTKQCNV